MPRGPYRSERERRFRALLFLAFFLLAVVLLRPWLNEGGDAKFWTASLIVVSLGASAIVESLRGVRA